MILNFEGKEVFLWFFTVKGKDKHVFLRFSERGWGHEFFFNKNVFFPFLFFLKHQNHQYIFMHLCAFKYSNLATWTENFVLFFVLYKKEEETKCDSHSEKNCYINFFPKNKMISIDFHCVWCNKNLMINYNNNNNNSKNIFLNNDFNCISTLSENLIKWCAVLKYSQAFFLKKRRGEKEEKWIEGRENDEWHERIERTCNIFGFLYSLVRRAIRLQFCLGGTGNTLRVPRGPKS